MATEIFLLRETGDIVFDESPNATFVKKCVAEGDPYIKEVPLTPGRTVFFCPVIKKEVGLSQDVCYGPAGESCEFNKLT